ncbi:MFS transporter [soil metagenome]
MLADVGQEIPTSLLPSLVTSTLGAPASALGLIEGVSHALAGAARFGGGALSDEPDRRRNLAVGGYTATAVLSAAIAPATAVWQVAVLRAGAWTARGIRVPARNALLADVVPAKFYGRAYGFERSMDNLGAILGPVAAIGLVVAVGARWAIALSVIPGLLATLAVIYAIRHTPKPTQQAKRKLRFHVRPVLTGELRRWFAGIGAFEFGNCAATLLVLRATELLDPTHSAERATTIALWLYVVYNIAATFTSLAAGHSSDRWGSTRVLTAGVAAFGLAYLGFSRDTTGWTALLPWFVLAGIGIDCVETAEHTAVATHAPDHLRGSSFGLLAATQSFGNRGQSSSA